tara:strand:- start:180246 stop:181508 length:1263 start_codon:yes stop_codon:yes gene_type:complete
MRPWPSLLVSLLVLVSPVLLAESTVPGFDGGHVKLRWQGSRYPGDSAYRAIFGEYANDEYADLRLKFSGSQQRLSFQADYQAIAQWGDSLDFPTDSAGLFLLPPGLPNDDRRWWDLTDTLADNNSRAMVQRFDRLNVGYNGDKTVLRFGRQAVSWGNGLIYNPVDFFNPFNPTAVDTEYKLGEDMFYAQHLLDDGSDWQAVFVQRRDPQGKVTGEASSTALKYHGFGLETEYDLLLAENFNEFIVGVGGVTNLGEAVLRGDITLTDAQDGWVTNLVVNWSWSWMLAGHNASVVLEYFYNGFGLAEDDYTPANIVADADLARRLERGELYTIGRHNIAGSLLVELAPLLNVTTNLFANAQDGSALAQVVLQWDLAQNWQLLAAATAPVGSKGTEYGGIEAGLEDLTLAVGPTALVQLAWYF